MDSLTIGLFWTSSLLIFPFWFLMWFMPGHHLTKRYVGDVRWCIVPLLVSYTVLALPNAAEVLMTFATQMPTPEIVVGLFEEDEFVVLAWMHLLALDLFAGRYVWLRMLSAKRPMYVSTPILIMCMMMGPLGFLMGLFATWNVLYPEPLESETLSE
ncbi:MAG: DUF4281 domain-containing protein [Euryarchaeota archaeon]|jgi:hypothetical protein|nr:DUF4281 domain-containing protein [Euryarchaeota archaeon]MBT5025821.1 DUF4281 domain-containing protein [Euryarchaeota archaeon]MBT6254870.1 DUF4281 domain-containing protein [Euryarchaeota archaeon]MBT6527300.1 DUF4281 domain-containing protein [Euryarchaeota archaeon]MBT7960528.1 DUF4281 domain-containing protein [Euryarchaeota archaeon]